MLQFYGCFIALRFCVVFHFVFWKKSVIGPFTIDVDITVNIMGTL